MKQTNTHFYASCQQLEWVGSAESLSEPEKYKYFENENILYSGLW